MTQKNIAKVVLTGLLGAALTAGAAYPQGKEPIKIGFVTSVTGPYADLGAQARRAAEFAVEEANKAGGVDGRKVELEVLDNEAKPDLTRRQAEKLSASGSHILMGLQGSGEALAILPMLERWNTLFISSIPRADQVTGSDCKFLGVRTNNQVAILNAGVKEWLSARKERKWAMISPDTAFGRGAGAGFKVALQGLSGSVSDEFFAPINTTDYAPYIEKIKSSGAEGVWITVSGTDAIALAKQMKQFGLTGKVAVAGISFITDSEAAQLGDAAKGFVNFINYSATIDTPQNKEFAKNWASKYNRAPWSQEGEFYMSFQVLFESVKASGSIDPKTLATYMAGKTFSTVMGNLVLRKEDHQMLTPAYIGSIEERNGVYTPVVTTTIPPEKVAPPVTCKF